jgi:hypothetical protein
MLRRVDFSRKSGNPHRVSCDDRQPVNMTAGKPTTVTPTLALILSLAIEAPVAAAVVAVGRAGRPAAAAGAAVVATLLTHGFAWRAILVASETLDWGIATAIVETLVVLVEAVVYRVVAGLSPRVALTVSFLANAASASFGIGLWIAGLD